ncbi:MAG: hypothetical protein HN568_01525 [Phycisphaerae bacterium]|nr:hypothetical protein [Phycisphaerae bacterium]
MGAKIMDQIDKIKAILGNFFPVCVFLESRRPPESRGATNVEPAYTVNAQIITIEATLQPSGPLSE